MVIASLSVSAPPLSTALDASVRGRYPPPQSMKRTGAHRTSQTMEYLAHAGLALDGPAVYVLAGCSSAQQACQRCRIGHRCLAGVALTEIGGSFAVALRTIVQQGTAACCCLFRRGDRDHQVGIEPRGGHAQQGDSNRPGKGADDH